MRTAAATPTIARRPAVAALARAIPHASWFAAVGEPVAAADRDDAAAWLAALGLPAAPVAPVARWADAKRLAQAPEWDTRWWEAEERERVALVAAAQAAHGADGVLAALTAVTRAASDTVLGAAAVAASRAGVSDPALIRAAAGAATQACYLAACARAAGRGDDHAFAVKLRLFEAGRWPLGVVAGRCHLF